jgi:predicted dehydrogenase
VNVTVEISVSGYAYVYKKLMTSSSTNPTPLHIGILGTAMITPAAMIVPARQVPEVQIVAVAARDMARAQHFAQQHGIAKTHPSYEALIADPDIDAVYNPLPNSLHAEWSIRAMRAGKHVLCEKPFASNATEAEQMAQVAVETGRVLSEAFAWVHHPIAARVNEVIANGEIGAVQHIEGEFRIPLIQRRNIRWRYDLAGGSLMDIGCYPLTWIRQVSNPFCGGEPIVDHASASTWTPKVDRWLRADFKLPNGGTARLTCAMLSIIPLRARVSIRGEHGIIDIGSPYHPQGSIYPHYVHVQTREGGLRCEDWASHSSYVCQLRAFARACNGSAPIVTDPAFGVANMRQIDAIYQAAGLPIRGDN